jgi:hypothetical protein
VGFDPALQKAGRHGQIGAAVDDRIEFQAAEPAGEDVLAQLGPQATLNPRPHLRGRLLSGTFDPALARSGKGAVILTAMHQCPLHEIPEKRQGLKRHCQF